MSEKQQAQPIFISQRGKELMSELYKQFNRFHSKSHKMNKEIELLLLEMKYAEIIDLDWFKSDIPQFGPSSISSCKRGMILKLMKTAKDEHQTFPFQQRWTRNSNAIHEAVQKDLLYMSEEKENPSFTVNFNENGADWEKNGAERKEFHHNGQSFAIAGMMDAKLTYIKDGKTIGFEYKTKSNTNAQVGTYKMKDAEESHKLQCIAYALLFDIDEFLIMYEAVAKDHWYKMGEARADIRTFYVNVTEKDKKDLLDKLAEVTKDYNEGILSEMETNKCMFCQFKKSCGGGKK